MCHLYVVYYRFLNDYSMFEEMNDNFGFLFGFRVFLVLNKRDIAVKNIAIVLSNSLLSMRWPLSTTRNHAEHGVLHLMLRLLLHGPFPTNPPTSLTLESGQHLKERSPWISVRLVQLLFLRLFQPLLTDDKYVVSFQLNDNSCGSPGTTRTGSIVAAGSVPFSFGQKSGFQSQNPSSCTEVKYYFFCYWWKDHHLDLLHGRFRLRTGCRQNPNGREDQWAYFFLLLVKWVHHDLLHWFFWSRYLLYNIGNGQSVIA